jgi:hypothetical protein
MEQVTQLGVSGLTLGILFFIVRYFVTAIKEKDLQINTMILDFNKTINNHIVHSTEQTKLQNIAFQELANAIKELTKEIKNGRK